MYMMNTVNLETKYKTMYNNFVTYCYKNNLVTSDDWDDTATAMWEEIQSFVSFCKIFFKIDIHNCIAHA